MSDANVPRSYGSLVGYRLQLSRLAGSPHDEQELVTLASKWIESAIDFMNGVTDEAIRSWTASSDEFLRGVADEVMQTRIVADALEKIPGLSEDHESLAEIKRLLPSPTTDPTLN
jgi:hypothetical protein